MLQSRDGAPPLEVDSTAMVENLNADLLDGFGAAEFVMDGDTVGQADNATTADDADTVDGKHAWEFLALDGTALNSSKVDGYDANDLVRAQHAANGDLNDAVFFALYPSGDGPLLSVEVVAPGRGILLAWAGTTPSSTAPPKSTSGVTSPSSVSARSRARSVASSSTPTATSTSVLARRREQSASLPGRMRSNSR